MSTAEAVRWMTMEEMLALPEDGVDRELIRGELRERPLTRRNRRHSSVENRVGQILANWLDSQPEPRGRIVSEEAGFRLARNPDVAVGIDVAYVSADVADVNPDGVFFEERRCWRWRFCRRRTSKRTLMRRCRCIWKRASV